MELFNEPIIERKTLSEVIKNDNVITNTSMVGGSFNGGKITIGSGENIFTANKDGIFLGSSSFDTAPFSVDMKGKMTASSAIISGDIESSNYTEVAPYTGYKLEYSTGDIYANQIIIRGGILDGTTTIGGRLCSTVAEAIDANGHFIDERFDTDSKTILSDFTFGASGALQIGTYESGVSGDIKISPNGILGRNKDGDTTFSINGTTGDATFGGTLVAASGTFGTVTAGILSGVEISGSTITGGTIQTAYTGDRIIMNGSTNSLEFNNSASLYAEINPYTLYQAGSPIGYGINIETGGNYATTPAQLNIYEGTSGNTFSSITSDFIDLDGTTFSMDIIPLTGNSYNLGSASYRYNNIYTNSIGLYGSSSGVVTLKPSASAGTWTLTLPTSAGSNGQVLTTNGSGTTSWATPSSFSGNWSDIYINTNKDMQGYNLTGITQVVPHSSNTSFLGSASYYWDWFYVRGIYGAGGTGDITIYNNLSMYNNTIQDINSLKLRTGQTTNPSSSGEIRFYDAAGGGFRGVVSGWLGQFDMTAK